MWHVEDRPLAVGAQETINLLGRLDPAVMSHHLHYRLNGGAWTPVYVKRPGDGVMRLQRPGDFNIDTIAAADLDDANELVLEGRDAHGITRRLERTFTVWRMGSSPDWEVQPDAGDPPHSHGQVIDGHWTTGRDSHGWWFGITAADSGLDRIILFTPTVRCTEYVVEAELCIDRWTRDLHNLGLLFDWGGHRVGDGTTLPPEWTTGLAYYYSNSVGMRVRLGRDVRTGPGNVRHGDVVLAERSWSRWRDWWARAVRRLPGTRPIGQLPTGELLRLHLHVQPDRYVFRIARDTGTPVELTAPRPDPDYLQPGAAGIIAHYCAVHVHRFDVSCRCPDGGPR